MKLTVRESMLSIVCIYAPQVRCEEKEKDRFWHDLDDTWMNIPAEEKAVLAGDFNGHTGVVNEAIERIHGRFGSGDLNTEGERVIDLVIAYDLAILNSLIKKPKYTTYESSGRGSQNCKKVLDEIDLKDEVEDWWTVNSVMMVWMITGKGSPENKETRW
ncbi:craniofacial development protein 2-like [Penaeus japonicus]|uniref:craniofacial development protein 2-like n=1 Tax=Penaeus japonicus TaxID=27405 RepID=UPI001C70C985|nr:craniofacial development protein 2-like [Penaeus japonicus]